MGHLEPLRKEKGRREHDMAAVEVKKKIELLKGNQLTFTIGGFITIILALFWITYYVTEYKGNTEHKFNIISTSIDSINKTNIERKIIDNKLQIENTDVKVRLATIETKLCNIEFLLIEIKRDIRRQK